ncbi:MAG: hypothetical protein GX576_13775 [Thauera phenolivorans]|uniref:DUF4124 domain-containing protein n=1 Tax=Thauera phenolivorans TaxID=1792543 RepID=A0A7X7LXY8_9RHOO|nr:hypothetical protein [Thauera phenolivorans]NLF55440.1 hypothetical protein [Thauera phenolivorans]
MASRRLVEFACAFALLAPLSAAAQSGHTVFCCEVNGRPVCADILPAVCYGKAYREMGPTGTVRRYVPAPLTADERARRDAQIERQRVAAETVRKQRRLDQALLETYQDADDIERRRERELGDIDRSIEELRARETTLVERQRTLLEEAGARDGERLPQALLDDIRNTEGEIEAQRSVINAKLRERGQVRTRFDEARRRYLELTAPERAAGRR